MRLLTWLQGRWRRTLLEAALFIGVLAAVQIYQAQGLPEGVAPSLEGVLTDGRTAKVGAGGTASLVVFWAAWCSVCRLEEGNINTIAQRWPVISVAMQSGGANEVTKHLQERGIDLPALVDADGRYAAVWRVRGVPTHFVIDPAGIVRFRVVGYATTLGLWARLWWAQTVPA